MKRYVLTLLVVVAVGWPGAAATAEQSRREREGKKRRSGESARVEDGDSYFHRRGYTRLDIPRGHYPPPGECRVWFPGRPAGHQPAPASCRELRSHVPPGAWLIRHPHDDREHVCVDVYDDRRPGAVLITGEFRIGTGVFVRVVMDR